ncbi:DUF6355 family natural product biosynthesis protein [Actinophytocola glycyrrhizae]|uniref:DUF6355 family natural product biosynthesis protein n=1 Tax=Actinophytocola glycyrrhizae TaxID=2044873 RepID=A0ABV9RU78_9PSEU
MFTRVAVAVAVAAGGLFATTGSATASTDTTITAPTITTVAAPVTAADDPCGYWREGNWLTGYSYWYRHCASTTVWVHITYYDGGFEDTCFGPWEKRQLSWRTNGAHSAGHLCGG